MGRHPEDLKAREKIVGIRLTPEERKQFDVQRWQRGNLSRAGYVRWLMRQDAVRLAAEGDNDG